MPTLDRQVSAGLDDISHRLETSPYWDMTNDNCAFGNYASNYYKYGSGLRFLNITIPQGATITAATLVCVSARDTPDTTCNCKVSAEDVDNAPAIADDSAAFYARFGNHTTARVTWGNIPAWSLGECGADTTSPELKTVIQEIVDRGGWQSGNAILIFAEDYDGLSSVDAWRGIASYEHETYNPATLHIEYTLPFTTYTKTYTADALFKKLGITKTLDADTLLKKLGILETVDADALIKKLGITKTFLAKVILGQSNITEITADVLLKALGLTQTLDVDALLQQQDITETVDIDTIIKLIATRSIDVDALLQKGLSQTLDADALFSKGLTQGVDVDALFLKSVTEAILADALLKKAFTETVDVDALLRGALTKTFTVDVRLGEVGAVAFTASVYFKRLAYHVILDGQYTQGSPGINRVYVIGKDSEGNPVYGTSYSQSEIDLVGERLDFTQDLSIPSTLHASNVAAAIVAKARLTGARGFIVIPPNCGQELWDVVQVTDKPTAQSSQKYRVIAVSFDYEPRHHRFEHKLILGAP